MVEPTPALKTCTKCGEQKALELFPVDYRSGRPRNPCKACKLLQTNAWRDNNKARVNARARMRSKSERSLEQTRERARLWRARNPEKKREEQRKYRAKLKQLKEQAVNEASPETNE